MPDKYAEKVKPVKDYFTTSDGISIHYMQLGFNGSYAVLIHGFTANQYGTWYANGIMDELAVNHRVVTLDCRNHGRSDKPEPGQPGIPSDVIELMDLLKIEKAHIHGFSLGGSITGQLLASHPERFITGSFGGSGIREEETEWVSRVPPDNENVDPEEVKASRVFLLRLVHGLSSRS